MVKSHQLVMVVVALGLASLACSGGIGAPTPTPVIPTEAPATAAPTKPPTPTRTPRPTATPKPTAVPLPEGVLLAEDFSSQEAAEAAGWSFKSGESVDRTWSANKLTLSVHEKQMMGLNWPAGGFDDFGVEVETQVESASAEYGLAFRIGGEEGARSYYIFGVTTDGKYYLDKLVAGEWSATPPIKPTASQYIKKGKARNTLGVLAQGSKLSLYVNGFLVKTVTDKSLASGGVGVFAGSGQSDSAQVSFSQFTIFTPEQALIEWGAAPAGGAASPPPPPTASGGGSTGTGDGLMTVRNSFPGACQANLWGPKNVVIRAEGNSSKSVWLPPGSYGAHLAVDIGEVDLSYQIRLVPGGRCTIVCDASTRSVYVTPASCQQK